MATPRKLELKELIPWVPVSSEPPSNITLDAGVQDKYDSRGGSTWNSNQMMIFINGVSVHSASQFEVNLVV